MMTDTIDQSSTFEWQIQDIISDLRQVPKGHVTRSALLVEDLGATPEALVAIHRAIEGEFKIKVTDAVAHGWRCFEDSAVYLRERGFGE